MRVDEPLSAQLVFDLPQRVARDRDAFLVAPSNAEAVNLVDTLTAWAAPVQWLYGPTGCGKTHLAAVLSELCTTHFLTADNLSEADIAPFLAGETQADVLIIEGLENLSHDAEEPLFHLLNHAKNSGQKLLLLSRHAPGQISVGLPDLQSRLKAVTAIGMAQPDDTLMCGLLDKLFADRQIKLDARVRDYLVPRISRDYATMGALVAELDRAALAAKKPITVPFVTRFLNGHNSVM